MEIETVPQVEEVAVPEVDELDEDEDDERNDADTVTVAHIWPELTPRAAQRYRKEIDHIQETFHDEIDMYDTTMCHEYAEEIFEYMNKLEVGRYCLIYPN